MKIFKASIAGLSPLRMPLYSASKAAVNKKLLFIKNKKNNYFVYKVNMITKVAALELGEKGIRCNSVK